MKLFVPIALFFSLFACGRSISSDMQSFQSPIEYSYEFTTDALAKNITTFFSDYPKGSEEGIPNNNEIHKRLQKFAEESGRPADLFETGNIVIGSGTYYLNQKYGQLVSTPTVQGLIFTQINRSDDVDSNIVITLGQEQGIVAGATYLVTGEVEFYSNTPTGGFGIGGAPDAVRYGLSVSKDNFTRGESKGYYRTMNGTKQNTNPFTDKYFMEMGAVNNGISAEEPNANDFVLQSLNTMRGVEVKAEKGVIYANFRTHSGFESYSIWAVKSVKLTVKKK